MSEYYEIGDPMPEIFNSEDEEREFQDIYTEEFGQKLLDVTNHKDMEVEDVLDLLSFSASIYNRFKRQREGSCTPKQATSKIAYTSKKCKEALQAFEGISDDFYIKQVFDKSSVMDKVYDEIFRYADPKEEEERIKRVEQNPFGESGYLSTDNYIYILKCAIKRLDGMSKNSKPENTYGMPKQFALDHWVSRLSSLFDEDDSDVKFTAGKYYKEIGYVSECLDVMHEIMSPIDSELTKQKIAESIIRELKQRKQEVLDHEEWLRETAEIRARRKKNRKIEKISPATLD